MLEESVEAAEEAARRLRHDKTLLEEQLETMTEENIMALATHDGDLQELRQHVTERDDTITQLRAELHEASIKHQTEMKTMETGHKALQREVVNKDGTISQLRDKLQTARFEYDEAKCLVQREIMELQRELEGERGRGSENDEIAREMQSAIADLERRRQALVAGRDEVSTGNR
jgi:chromosome segregation ATPase